MFNNFKLTTDQKNTLKVFRKFLSKSEEKYMIIQGAAGSGKSTLITHLIDILETQFKMYTLLLQKNPRKGKFEVVLSATTNKAVAVLKELTGFDAKTIHSVLGLKVTFNFKTGEPNLTKKNGYKLLYNKLIIVDEASMINDELYEVLDETTKDSKIILIGDQYQLAPVKQKLSLMESLKCTKVEMNKVMRNAGAIKHTGAQFRETVETGVFKPIIDAPTVKHVDGPTFKKLITTAFTSRNYDANFAKVLAWTNSRVHEYNQHIRQIKNLPAEFQIGETVITNNPLMGRVTFWPVDSAVKITKILPNKEKYDVPGQIMEIDDALSAFYPESPVLKKQKLQAFAKLKDWVHYYKVKETWLDLRPIYASTVHKAQGSSYHNVFIDLSDIGRCRVASDVARLLYVAISRATHQVILYGELPDHYK